MSGYRAGNKTFGFTGLQTINLGTPSAPIWIMIAVQNKFATNEGALKHVSMAVWDGSVVDLLSYIKNGTNPSFDINFTDGKIIRVYEEIGGVNTVVFEGVFDSVYTNGVKINITTANAAYPVYIWAKY